MTSKAAILTLLTLWGVGTALPHQAWAEETTSSEQSSDSKDDETGLTNKVWVKAGDDAALPGVIKVFLSDGTLVQDSCWETHRLSPWQMTDAKSLTWNEDGMDIKADIVTLTADELVLSLKLKGGDVQEHYKPAPVPSVCPDMPKA
jgi:hypothetical protein|nr:hypothetical protein [uncultured bacterium]